MIRGTVTPARTAIIPLKVHGPGGQLEIDAIVDTGFNGSLTLPPAIVTVLALPYALPVQATLADGRIVVTSCHEARVDWDGSLRNVMALVADGEPLVGMSLLSSFDLFIEGVTGGDVRITRRP